MMRKSASLFEWLSWLRGVWVCVPFGVGGLGLGWFMGHMRTGLRLPFGVGAMCRGSCVKDHGCGHVQLESLILAQNERWRQA